MMMNNGEGDWQDWRQGECIVPALLGKFYDTQMYTDCTFHLADGSTVQGHKLLMAISSPVFEGMFFGTGVDPSNRDFKVDDVKPVGFRRLIQFVYNSRAASWKVEDPEEWWHILEVANKYMNFRLVEQVERKLRDISKKEAGKGVILKHLNMSNRCSFESGVKSVLLNSVIKNTSKLIQSDQWAHLDEGTITKIYDQEFLAANEGELYVGAKSWCLRNTSSEGEALRMFLDKFVSKIIPEYMSQRDFLTCVANDAFLAQVDVFRDWTIKIMVKNAEDNTIRGSYRPMRILEFYFNAKTGANPMNPVSFKQETAYIDFQEETTKYTAALTTILDGEGTGLHLNLKTESSAKPSQGNKPLSFVKPGPKSTKLPLPNLPEMMSDEEAQKSARKSALLIAKMRDGSYKSEVMVNLDDSGSGFTSANMFDGKCADIEFVQVLVVIDARPSVKVSVISHKQFVEHVGITDVPNRENLEESEFAREFEFRADTYSMENAEKEICRTLKLKDCQAWYVNDENRCRKRESAKGGENELQSYLRYDAIYKMLMKVIQDINANRGRTGYTGKGGDETDKFLMQLNALMQKYKVSHFWIMLEKEFKDDTDKLVSSVCKYDSSSGKLNYCGTICLQMNEENTLKPTTEFFNMILYNSDPNSKVYLRRFLNPLNVTKVSPSDDIEGINNFDIFVIQEGAKTSDGVISDYDKFITQKINEFPVTFRSKNGLEDKTVMVALDRTQGVRHAKSKLLETLEIPAGASVTLWECMSSEAVAANPLKKKTFRKPLDMPLSDDDQRRVAEMFSNCEDGSKTLYYHL